MQNSQNKLQLFDFDRTLFNTAKFYDDIWNFIAVEYGVDAALEKTRAHDFYRHVNKWYDYDFFGHVTAIARIQDNSDTFRMKAHAALNKDYLFDDAREILQYCDEIVTFGNEPFQSFKLGFCKQLARFAVHIIDNEKGDYITTTFPNRAIILLDDKPLESTLSEYVSFIQIDRSQTQPIQRGKRSIIINSLVLYQEAVRLFE